MHVVKNCNITQARQGMSTEIMNHSSTHCSTSQASVTVSANKLEWEFRCNMGVCSSLKYSSTTTTLHILPTGTIIWCWRSLLVIRNAAYPLRYASKDNLQDFGWVV
eukprot:scpid91666/ scgid25928/ 